MFGTIFVILTRGLCTKNQIKDAVDLENIFNFELHVINFGMTTLFGCAHF